MKYYIVTKIIIISVIALFGISMLLKFHKMNVTDPDYKIIRGLMLLQLWLVGITALIALERVAIYVYF